MPSPVSASPLDRHAAPTASSDRRSGRAITALVLGILALITCVIPIVSWILGIIAIVLGANARADIRRNNCLGANQAKAAIILGIVALLLATALVALAVSQA
jgi:thiol:disulfide interchange protein